MLIGFFYGRLGWLPGGARIDKFIPPPPTVTGLYTVDSLLAGNAKAFWSSAQHLFLPALTLGYFSTAIIARMMRSSMLEVLNQDYVLAARAKGLRQGKVIWRHALRNALIPTVTTIGVTFGSLLSGAVLTETIFSWPGLGALCHQLRHQPRLPGRDGRDPSGGRGLHGGQPDGRRGLSLARPADSQWLRRAGVLGASAGHPARPRRRPAWLRSPLTVAGLVLITLFALAALFAPVLAPADPLKQVLSTRLKPPSAAHWLGTDQLGRDMLSRMIFGARISLLVGVVVVGLAGSLGTFVGLVAGYTGGWLDEGLMRLTDVFFAFPALILAMAISGAWPEPEQRHDRHCGSVVAGVCAAGAGQVLTLREREYVEAARSLGASPRASSGSTSCPTPWRRCWCRPASTWAAPSWRRPG